MRSRNGIDFQRSVSPIKISHMYDNKTNVVKTARKTGLFCVFCINSATTLKTH